MHVWGRGTLQPVCPVPYLEPPAAQCYLGDAVNQRPSGSGCSSGAAATDTAQRWWPGHRLQPAESIEIEWGPAKGQSVPYLLTAGHLAVAELQPPERVAVHQQGLEPGEKKGRERDLTPPWGETEATGKRNKRGPWIEKEQGSKIGPLWLSPY